jgi:hypothetical protein
MSGTITLNTPGGDIPGTIEIQNAAPNKARMLIKADLTALGAGPLAVAARSASAWRLVLVAATFYGMCCGRR